MKMIPYCNPLNQIYPISDIKQFYLQSGYVNELKLINKKVIRSIKTVDNLRNAIFYKI